LKWPRQTGPTQFLSSLAGLPGDLARRTV
jgi:hypothetical protein